MSDTLDNLHGRDLGAAIRRVTVDDSHPPATQYQFDPRWRASHHGAGQWAVEHLPPRARRWQFVTWAPRAGAPGSPEWLRAAHRAGILRQTGREPEVARAAQQALAGRAVSIMALPALRDAITAAWLDGARGADLDAVAVAFLDKHQ